MASEYGVANMVARMAQRQYPVEIGAVVGVNPLVLQIGNAQYDSTQWVMWQAYNEDKDIKMEEITVTGTDSRGGAVHINPILSAKKAKSEMDIKIGDRVAVQQLADGKSFLILSKARRL